MYEKFTDRARKILQLANQEAQRFGYEKIAAEHVLLALTTTQSCVAVRILKNLHANPCKICGDTEILLMKQANSSRTDRRLPLDPGVKKIVIYAMEEAGDFQHDFIGSEHLLLGLLHLRDGIVAEVLTNNGLTLDGVRQEVLSLLGPGMCKPLSLESVDRVQQGVTRRTSEPPARCPVCGRPFQRAQSWSLTGIFRRLFRR